MVGPDGQRWVVQRRWMPRLGGETLWGRFRKRIRQAVRSARGIAEGTGEVAGEGAGCLLDLEAAVIFVVFLAALALFVLLVYPLLIAVVDVVILIVVAIAGLVGRVCFRRPWTIQARADDGTVHRWKTVGWRASRQRRDEIAQQLAAGIVPAPDTPTPGTDLVR